MAVMRLPGKISEKDEKLKAEMMDGLKKLGMDYSITGHGTPMILIWEVGIPRPTLWCPKTDLSWIITNKITIFSKNSDQYLSFEGLWITGSSQKLVFSE